MKRGSIFPTLITKVEKQDVVEEHLNQKIKILNLHLNLSYYQ